MTITQPLISPMISPLIPVMRQALQAAAESLLHDFHHVQELTVEHKGKGDLVSQADKKAEKIIVEILQNAQPDWGFLGEEGSHIIGADARYRWIIDPLDGTANFLHGLPHWCVTVALECDDEIIAGMTYSPLTDEWFHAIKDGGAFRNDERLQVTTCMELDDAMVLVDLGHRCCGADKTSLLHELAEHSGTLRILGSGALSLAYVASGYYDAMLHSGGAPWDFAAGFLMVREAGGMVSDFHGGDAPYIDNRGMIASNIALQPKMLALIPLANAG